jgi:hypothetical protein
MICPFAKINPILFKLDTTYQGADATAIFAVCRSRSRINTRATGVARKLKRIKLAGKGWDKNGMEKGQRKYTVS